VYNRALTTNEIAAIYARAVRQVHAAAGSPVFTLQPANRSVTPDRNDFSARHRTAPLPFNGA